MLKKEFTNTNIDSEEKTSCYPDKNQAPNMTDLDRIIKSQN